MFNEDEKTLLKSLVKKELEEFEKKEIGIVDMPPQFLKGEKKYEMFLKELIKKLS